jgi:hypothetical protein
VQGGREVRDSDDDTATDSVLSSNRALSQDLSRKSIGIP